MAKVNCFSARWINMGSWVQTLEVLNFIGLIKLKHVISSFIFNIVFDMKNNTSQDERIAKMSFAKVYPLYLTKVEKKGRTKQELDEVILWLTSYTPYELEQALLENLNFEVFFANAQLHPNAHLITGLICGYRVEEIENKLTQQVRFLDKLVDELAKGKKIEKILRV
jgi:hypothetical protein